MEDSTLEKADRTFFVHNHDGNGRKKGSKLMERNAGKQEEARKCKIKNATPTLDEDGFVQECPFLTAFLGGDVKFKSEDGGECWILSGVEDKKIGMSACPHTREGAKVHQAKLDKIKSQRQISYGVVRAQA